MVIDTNIIIDHLRTGEKTRTVFTSILGKRRLCISSITVFELYKGAQTEAKQQDVKKILRGLEVLPCDERVAILAAAIAKDLQKKGELIGLFDILIAATALIHKQPVRTENRSEFERVPNLRVI